MKPVSRRDLLRQASVWGAASASLAVLAVRSQVFAEEPPRVIEVVAKRFKFTPADIPMKVGERVVLHVRSLDFVHGMNLPDFGKRADLVPGQITRIELQPQRSGTFDFVCDNFCGDGHEEMHGRLIVSA